MLVIYTTVSYSKQVVPNFHWNAIFPNKKAYFSNNSANNAYKNVDGNPKFHITKLNPRKSYFLKQPIMAEAEINFSVTPANKYKVKAKNFIIPIFYLPVLFLR